MSKGFSVARQALEKLLRRAENAWAHGALRECTLRFTEASFPDYLKLPSRADKDDAHALLKNAERTGDISIEWDNLAGVNGHINRIVLLDKESLATTLQKKPLWILYKEACAALDTWKNKPSVSSVLERWRAGKNVQGYGPERIDDFVDACKVIDSFSGTTQKEDIPIRRMSASLFFDSKRIEAIVPALDVLTSESIESPRRDVEEVLSPLGLVKLPYPILIGGRFQVHLNDNQIIKSPPRFLGFPPQDIKAIFPDTHESNLLTVENLTTFNEVCNGTLGPVDGIVIYTAGMPSPALLRVYRILLQGSPMLKRRHWGDIDLGGLRIAAALARQDDRPLELWMMDPAELEGVPYRKELSAEERREIQCIGHQHGWQEITDRIAEDGRAIEQEAVSGRVPF